MEQAPSRRAGLSALFNFFLDRTFRRNLRPDLASVHLPRSYRAPTDFATWPDLEPTCEPYADEYDVKERMAKGEDGGQTTEEAEHQGGDEHLWDDDQDLSETDTCTTGRRKIVVRLPGAQTSGSVTQPSSFPENVSDLYDAWDSEKDSEVQDTDLIKRSDQEEEAEEEPSWGGVATATEMQW